MKGLSKKDHDKMTEHELRTEVILLRAKINRLENKPKVTREFAQKWAYRTNDVWEGKIKEMDFVIKLLTEVDIEVEK